MDEAGEELAHVGVGFGFGFGFRLRRVFGSRDPIEGRMEDLRGGGEGIEGLGGRLRRPMEVAAEEGAERVSDSVSFEVGEQEEWEISHLYPLKP